MTARCRDLTVVREILYVQSTKNLLFCLGCNRFHRSRSLWSIYANARFQECSDVFDFSRNKLHAITGGALFFLACYVLARSTY